MPLELRFSIGLAALALFGCTEIDPGYQPFLPEAGSSGGEDPTTAAQPGATSTTGPSGPATNSTSESGEVTSSGDGLTSGTGEGTGTTGPTGCAADPDCDWWDASWKHRLRLDVDPGTLSTPFWDFPLMVALDSDRVDFGDFAADGRDIRFVTDAGVVLDHDVDTWSVAGASTIWVRVPDFDSGPSVLWMYYGNPDAQANSAEGAWSEDYRAVWHLGEKLDCAAGADHPLTDVGTTVANGFVGQGRRLGGDGDYLDAGVVQDIKVQGDLTISLWLRMTTIDDGFMANPIVASGVSDEASIEAGALAGWLGLNGSGEFVASWSRSSGNAITVSSSEPAPIVAGQWHHVAFVRYGSEFVRFFVDGEQIGNDRSFGDDPLEIPDARTLIGADPGAPDETSIDATIDEVRLFSRTQPAEWIGTEVRAARDELITYGIPEDYW